ncbi:hypothetical protein FGO68_gene9991 [Halteria grandinella]|uniref:Transcription and mRNA export factor ENY2 n=1 Tax=Halteria grandinella TaxID=5974 RepID=A0A8J8NMC4_HALGN|nr:hypothetical protein FGO68_gene9991 [Halteria grandinella]
MQANDIAQKKSFIEARLEQTGEKGKLEEFLRQQLAQGQWKEEMKKRCLEEIRQQGLEKINLDTLVDKMLPQGRSLVPQEVKEKLLDKIKGVLEQDPEYKKLTGFDQ